MSAKDGEALLGQAKLGDYRAFSRFLTWLERAPAREAFQLAELKNPAATAFRLGITGPPGAGKSTLVSGLLKGLGDLGLRIGVMAVDPSSPFSKGAILGDRIRYSEHFLNPKIFIRSLGTRGSLGGLSSAAYLMARAFDACGFDILLIETVGVGQTELDILHVADHVCVVLVPESGDSIQAMKAGLMEIANLFVVNKADRPGADSLVREIESAQHDGAASPVPVLSCVASEGKGVGEILRVINEFRLQTKFKDKRGAPERLRMEARALLRREWERDLDQKLKGVANADDMARLFSK